MLQALHLGVVAFPNDFTSHQHADELLRQCGPLAAVEFNTLGVEVSTAGRMMFKRLMGHGGVLHAALDSMGPSGSPI